MFADNQRISHRQLFRQLVLGQLGIYLVTIPVTSYLEGRQGAPPASPPDMGWQGW